jgi:NAD-dependent dihydropyrimidine dehydrogenase PreA subunit
LAVKIDREKCTGCYACVINCPYALFTIVDGKANVDNKDCVSCAICVQSCENKAIVLVPGKSLGGGGY